MSLDEVKQPSECLRVHANECRQVAVLCPRVQRALYVATAASHKQEPTAESEFPRNVARPHHRGRAPVTPARTCGNPAEAVRFSLNDAIYLTNDAIYLTSDERRPAQPPMT
ncbi:hypothetical protein BVI434_180106 [Burkholderia vietnamiensis]|nr:hypothetical protein BVI434_180106 [Burkholderia vietnamiensis]